MSYARMNEAERQYDIEVRALVEQAEQAYAGEYAQYGLGQYGDDLPAELARGASRLAKIRAAKVVLEQQAREDAARAADAGRAKRAAREQRVGSAKGGVPKVPDPAQAQPEPGAQYNFTDPASRIMLDGASKSWVQAYNAQAAVDDQAQIVVACAVTQEAIDVQQFVPLLSQVQTNTGQQPTVVTADAGYFSEANLTATALEGLDCYVPPDRHTHGRAPAPTARARSAIADRMREKLRAPAGRRVYARRKAIVEPGFGQAKEGRALRRFSLPGYDQDAPDGGPVFFTPNLLHLFLLRP